VVTRLLGLLLFVGGLLHLLVGIAGSWGKIGLVYWQTFLTMVILPPVLWSLAGLLLLLLAVPVARFLSRGLDRVDTE